MSRWAVQAASRRRFLGVIAGGAATLLAPGALAELPLTRWRGYALGAEASLVVRDPDRARAKQAIADCVAEVARIEQIFSLHRRDSLLRALNRQGRLEEPPRDLVDVLSFASRMSAISEGAFDVTVQPLWGAHVRAQRDPRSRSASLERARSLIDWRRLTIDTSKVAFENTGMAATLNGIAQGYATDRIAERLRAHGFPHVLVNLGEFRGLGKKAADLRWRIGVGWPGRDGIAATLDLSDRAVATSSPLATPFDAEGKSHHLFDPRSGRSAESWTSVTVVAPTAMEADALSTAIAVAPKAAAKAIFRAGGGEEAIVVDRRGRLRRFRS